MAPSFEEIDWYDLPALYDIVFDVDTPREADFLEEIQRRYGDTRQRRVLEPACGSGRLIVALARRGWTVFGTDLNAPMLGYGSRPKVSVTSITSLISTWPSPVI